jgi:hypothetical protein
MLIIAHGTYVYKRLEYSRNCISVPEGNGLITEYWYGKSALSIWPHLLL